MAISELQYVTNWVSLGCRHIIVHSTNLTTYQYCQRRNHQHSVLCAYRWIPRYKSWKYAHDMMPLLSNAAIVSVKTHSLQLYYQLHKQCIASRFHVNQQYIYTHIHTHTHTHIYIYKCRNCPCDKNSAGPSTGTMLISQLRMCFSFLTLLNHNCVHTYSPIRPFIKMNYGISREK